MSNSIRLSVRTATKEDIKIVNEQWKALGLRSRISSTEKALEEAKGAVSATPSKLRKWVFHPDERVPLALMNNPHEPWGLDYEWYASAALAKRAMRINEEEGCVWNPILDSFKTGLSFPSYDDVKKWNEHDGRHFGPLNADRTSSFVWADPVEKLLEESKGDNIALQCLQCKSSRVIDLVGKKISVITPAVWKEAETRPEVLKSLSASSALSDPQFQYIVRWATKTLIQSEEGYRNKNEVKRAAILASDALSKIITNIRDEDRKSFFVHETDKLIEVLEKRVNPKNRFFTWDHLIKSSLIKIIKGLTTEQISRIYVPLRNDTWSITAILRAKQVEPSVACDILKLKWREQKFQDAVIYNAQLLRDEDVCSIMAQSRASQLEEQILSHGLGPGFTQVFKRKFKDDPRRALELVDLRVPEVKTELVSIADSGFGNQEFEDPSIGRAARSCLLQARALSTPPEEFSSAFDKLVEHGAIGRHIVRTIEAASVEQKKTIRPEQLSPLLKSEHRPLRVAVIELLARIQNPITEDSPQTLAPKKR